MAFCYFYEFSNSLRFVSDCGVNFREILLNRVEDLVIRSLERDFNVEFILRPVADIELFEYSLIEYQIISTLPAITSESTYLTTYTFVDTLSKGVTYATGDVVLEFFTDNACTDSVAKWTEADGKFTAAYNTIEGGETMTIAITPTGLAEINTSKAVYSAAGITC